MKLVTVEEMIAVEKEANEQGITYDHMMDSAGRGLATVVAEEFDETMNAGVLGLVGSGNNGGDTLVALAVLAEEGWRASAYIVRPRPGDDPLVEHLEQAGGKIYRMEDDQGFDLLRDLLEEHAVLLDGVLGTGIQLPLRGRVAEVLAAVREEIANMENRPWVVAVDCPSGVDSDSGEAAPECIPADITVTMAAVKTGLLKFPAHQLVGDLRLVGIGLPEGGETLGAWRSINRTVTSPGWVRDVLPERSDNSHKGTFGTALLVAGSVNYTGAVLLAGEAAYRSGAGLVTAAVVGPLHAALAGHLPEATWLILPSEMGVIAPGAAEILRKNLERVTALLIGPGFGTEDATAEFMERLLNPNSTPARSAIGFVRAAASSGVRPGVDLPPLVIDADGLKLLARIDEWYKRLPPETVLTPHPGEMAVITKLSVEEIQADRLGIATRFSQEWGHVVVLKGAFTVIAAPDGRVAVIPVASSALARAGTGDVLAGLIVGLRAQGMDAFDAAQAGAWIHAQAGLAAASFLGNTASVLAGDVLRAVPDVLSEILV